MFGTGSIHDSQGMTDELSDCMVMPCLLDECRAFSDLCRVTNIYYLTAVKIVTPKYSGIVFESGWRWTVGIS